MAFCCCAARIYHGSHQHDLLCHKDIRPKLAGQSFVHMQHMEAGSSRALLRVTWLPAGDLVKEDDVLMQIETDKVTIDVRYTESEAGTLTEYLCKEDDTVAVGQEVVKVDKGEPCP